MLVHVDRHLLSQWLMISIYDTDLNETGLKQRYIYSASVIKILQLHFQQLQWSLELYWDINRACNSNIFDHYQYCLFWACALHWTGVMCYADLHHAVQGQPLIESACTEPPSYDMTCSLLLMYNTNDRNTNDMAYADVAYASDIAYPSCQCGGVLGTCIASCGQDLTSTCALSKQPLEEQSLTHFQCTISLASLP